MTTSASIRQARELYELKERAAKYYAENGVPQKMEEIMNAMFYDNPLDVYGHLVNYFQGFACAPTITKVKARSAVDSRAHSTIQTEVYCTVNNKEQLICTCLSSSTCPLLVETAKPEEREEEETEREENVTAAIKYINSEINTKLKGFDPTKQVEADALICELINELKEAEDERLAKEAEERGTEGSEELEKKSGSAISKPKSGKGKGGKGGAPVVVIPDEPREKFLCGSNCVSAVSQALCCAGATAMNSPLYEYIARLRFSQFDRDDSAEDSTRQSNSHLSGTNSSRSSLDSNSTESIVSTDVSSSQDGTVSVISPQEDTSIKENEVPTEFRIPLPMVTILQSGRAAPGKSNCIKEYMVVPKPGKDLKETLPQIQAIYNHIVKSLLNKNTVPTTRKGDQGAANKKHETVAAKNVTDNGALMVSFDRPEQGLDMIQEAMTHLELTPGEDFFIALNLAGHEIFDYEKGKYEVITGQQKVADDVVDYWADLLGKYPSVIAIIDPLRKQEDKQWMSLCERLSERCYIIGDRVHHRPGLLKDEELLETFKTSGVVYNMEQMTTLSDLMECAKKMEEAENQTVMAANVGETTDTFLADLAVGINARFLKIGGPSRGERVCKLNRLLAIEEQLQEQGKLAHHSVFEFPVITIPLPPDGGEEGEATEEEKKETPRKK